MKTIIAAAALTIGMAAAAVGTVADAQQGPGPGGRGYGPGMMGGYGGGGGYGPGMMGGYAGPGAGRGGYGVFSIPGLTDEQREQIAKIQEENRAKNWNTMGQVRAEQFKLRQMYYADKADPNAVAEQQRKVDELRRNMLKSRIESRNQIAAVLTPEQKQQLRAYGPWWMQDESD